jgi:hypothetical protein
MFSNHLSFETIADLVEGRLSAEANGKAAQHIADCSSCSQTAKKLGHVASVMRTDDLEDAPAHALQRAFSIMPRRVIEEKPSVLHKVLAALSFDSAFSQSAYGLRSGATAARQIIFKAGEMDIDLRITPSENNWTIMGQILGECSGGRVELKTENESFETTLNELCEFKLGPIAAGTYTMYLISSDTEIKIPEINIGD